MSSRFQNLRDNLEVLESWRKSVDWWLLWATLCSGITLLFIILINVAGTGLHASTSSTKYNSTTAGNFHVIEVQSIYAYNGEYNYTGSYHYVPSWNHRFYLNGACSTPNICLDLPDRCPNHTYPVSNFSQQEAHAFWPICFYTGVGHCINIFDLLYAMDNYLYRNNSQFPLGPSYYGYLPPGHSSNVANDGFLMPYTIGTHNPFALYVTSAVACVLFLSGVAGTVAMRHLFKEAAVEWLDTSPIPPFVGLILNLFTLAACFVAVVLVNVAANKILGSMYEADDINNAIEIGHPFLALAWTINVLQSIATAIFIVRWRLKCRKPEPNVASEDRRVNMRETGRVSVEEPPPPYE